MARVLVCMCVPTLPATVTNACLHSDLWVLNEQCKHLYAPLNATSTYLPKANQTVVYVFAMFCLPNAFKAKLSLLFLAVVDLHLYKDLSLSSMQV